MARETLTKPGLALEDTERLAQDELRRLRALPLWQVRLRLLGRSLAAQWRLFAEQPIGLIGLAIILCFGAFALIHPLLMGRVWPRAIYDPIIGYDPAFPSHPVGPSAAHWLGSSGEVGACSTVRKSTRLRNPSGRASCSGRARRSARTNAAAASTAMIVSRSRMRRAGKTFTRIVVVAAPIAAGTTRSGSSAAAATSAKSGPPSNTTP